MKNITFKLVHTAPNQRFYQSNQLITKGINSLKGKIVDVPAELDIEREKHFKPEYKHLCPVGGADIICVSDANTHIERLVFVGMKYEEDGELKYGRTKIQIQGRFTFLIHGGDIYSVKPDAVYLRSLAILNSK